VGYGADAGCSYDCNMTPSQQIVQQVSEASGVLGKKVPDVIYHYTTIDVLNGIMFGNPNPDMISFFFTHFQHLNDKTEVCYGLDAIDIVAKTYACELTKKYDEGDGAVFQEIAARDLVLKMLYSIMVRFREERIARNCVNEYILMEPTKERFRELLNEALTDQRSSVFIGSFSRLSDSERMWCDYAGGGRGVCLVLDTKKILAALPFKALGLVNSVKYIKKPALDAIIDAFFRKIIDAIVAHKSQTNSLDALIAKKPDIENDLFTLIAFRLVEFISTTKEPLWSHEDEVRVFFPHLKTEGIKDIQYRISQDGRLIPYIPLSFPKDVLLDIIPGRKCSETSRKAINLMRKTKGFLGD
jgi:hypothetical protein